MIKSLGEIWTIENGTKFLRIDLCEVFVDLNRFGSLCIKCVENNACKRFEFSEKGLAKLNKYLSKI